MKTDILWGRGYKDFISFLKDYCGSKFKKLRKEGRRKEARKEKRKERKYYPKRIKSGFSLFVEFN